MYIYFIDQTLASFQFKSCTELDSLRYRGGILSILSILTICFTTRSNVKNEHLVVTVGCTKDLVKPNNLTLKWADT